MEDVNTTISKLTLNVNVLNNPIKRQRLSDRINEKICCQQDTNFRHKGTNRMIFKRWTEIYLANSNCNKPGLVIQI